jgi:alkylhydroperoxidase family enzyme
MRFMGFMEYAWFMDSSKHVMASATTFNYSMRFMEFMEYAWFMDSSKHVMASATTFW